MDIYAYDGKNIVTIVDGKIVDIIPLNIRDDHINLCAIHPLPNYRYVLSQADIRKDKLIIGELGNKNIIIQEGLGLFKQPIYDGIFTSLNNYIHITDDNKIISTIADDRKYSMIIPANNKDPNATYINIKNLLSYGITYKYQGLRDLTYTVIKFNDIIIELDYYARILAWFDLQFLITYGRPDLNKKEFENIDEYANLAQYIIFYDISNNISNIIEKIDIKDLNLSDIVDYDNRVNKDDSIDIFLLDNSNVVVLHITKERNVEVESYFNIKSTLNISNDKLTKINGDEYGIMISDSDNNWYYINRYNSNINYIGKYYFLAFTHERLERNKEINKLNIGLNETLNPHLIRIVSNY